MTNQPTTPANHWSATREDPHAKRYQAARVICCAIGYLPIQELASKIENGYYKPLNLEALEKQDRSYFSPISLMTALKDNIRWLSRKLLELHKEVVASSPPELTAAFSEDCHSAFLTNRRIRNHEQERAKLRYGSLTDDEIANIAFMLYDSDECAPVDGKLVNGRQITTAAIERLRWLGEMVESFDQKSLKNDDISWLVAKGATVRTEPYLRRGIKVVITNGDKTFSSTTARNRNLKELLTSTIRRWRDLEEKELHSPNTMLRDAA